MTDISFCLFIMLYTLVLLHGFAREVKRILQIAHGHIL